jgi:hypothetical protein
LRRTWKTQLSPTAQARQRPPGRLDDHAEQGGERPLLELGLGVPRQRAGDGGRRPARLQRHQPGRPAHRRPHEGIDQQAGPLAGEAALGGSVGQREAGGAGVAGIGVLVLGGAVAALRQVEGAPAQRRVVGHGSP